MSPEERIRRYIEFLYPQQVDQIVEQLQRLIEDFSRSHPELTRDAAASQLSERDAILITYGDQFQSPRQSPLLTLKVFLDEYLPLLISGVHILPFFPYSSDDGFSVIDYRQVDPSLGSWEDILALRSSYRLMFDDVINHISRESEWFQRFISGDPEVQDDFIVVSPEQDLSSVVRPRTLPLLTPVTTRQGTVYVWTTFSSDQIDLNYGNPGVLLKMVDLLLFYAAHGADLIRLDAVAYLCKEIGTTCIHLPQTHAVVKLFRAVLDAAAPDVLLVTETNVPHEENISYFGEPLAGYAGTDEAQMVYAFPLAPLVLHTFYSGSTRTLADWVASLSPLPAGAAYFNFLASHDGIGVRPAEGLLTPRQIDTLVEKALAHGGRVSYKTNPDGTQSPYELNTTWYDALTDPDSPDPEIDVQRFLASQFIMLSLAGVPGIYIHSLFGSRNCFGCYEKTGRARSLNREKFQLQWLKEQLAEPDSIQSRVFSGYRQLLKVRREQRAFHPQGSQQVLSVGDHVFALLRKSPNDEQQVICLVEAAGRSCQVSIDLDACQLSGGMWVNLLDGKDIQGSGRELRFPLQPYGYAWLTPIEY